MAISNGNVLSIRISVSWVLLLVVFIFLAFLTDDLKALRPLIPKSKLVGTTSTLPPGEGRPLASASSVISNDSNTCATDHNIAISQGSAPPLTDGTPSFIVQIINTCIDECVLEDIHLHCGSFASTRMINPKIFRRIAYDDCIVNDGNRLNTGSVVSFEYSNNFMYPLSLASLTCISNSAENIH